MDANKPIGTTPAMESMVRQEHLVQAMRDLSSGQIDAITSATPLHNAIMASAHDLASKLAEDGVPPGLAAAAGSFCASLAAVSAMTMRYALWETVLGEM